jgi:hypothetical protein
MDRRWLVATLVIALITPLAFVAANVTNQPHHEEFRFARMEYDGGTPGALKNWYTDYPDMDDHFTTVVSRLTGIAMGPPVTVAPSSPDVFNYPLLYSVEPEQIVLSSKDIDNLREYLARGGLWFADDFHGDEEFDQFMTQVRRVLPNASIVELDVTHPLFHCFFDINEIIQVTNDGIAKCKTCDQWENGPSGKTPKVFAALDEHGRIEILMAWNTDLGDGLEWADDPDYPSAYSRYSFKFVSDVLVYAMTH